MATQKKKAKDASKMFTLNRDGLVTYGEHLAGKAGQRFRLSGAGRMYLPRIEAGLAALPKATPVPPPAPAVPKGPSPEALTEHTELGEAIVSGLKQLTRSPNLSPEVKAAAARVLDVFGEKPLAWNASAPVRVERATVVRRDTAPLGADLARLPEPAGGGSFADWIDRWCALGSAMADAVVDGRVARSQPKEEAPKENAATPVSRLNGLIFRARAALRDEIEFDPTLPPTLETEVFGLYDALLEAHRTAARMAAPRRSATP